MSCKRLIANVIGAGLLLVVPGVVAGAEDGAALYKTKCAGCHGASGEGKPAMKAPALKGTSLSAEQITQHLTKGEATSKAPHNKGKATIPSVASSPKAFDSPQQAADVLIEAAEKFDVGVLVQIFGPDGADIVLSGEYPQDRKRASDFASEAREKKSVSVDPKTGNRAFLLVGNEDWPFPVPIVKLADKWHFDAKAGRQELLYRRIGGNELDAIDICHGYVEAQYEYAYQKREGYAVNQYAQRIISTPGKQDGLAWLGKTWTAVGAVRSAKRSPARSNKVTPPICSRTTAISSKF
jgi:hypothetical protein